MIMKTSDDMGLSTEVEVKNILDLNDKYTFEKCYFNRKVWWTHHHEKAGVPSFREFVDYILSHGSAPGTLLCSRDSKKPDELKIADGNNRANAISFVRKHPVELYSDKFDKLVLSELRTTGPPVTPKLIAHISKYFYDLDIGSLVNVGYDDIAFVMEKEFPEIRNAIISKTLSNAIRNFRCVFRLKNDSSRYLPTVNVCLQIYNNYSEEEMASVYIEVNKNCRTMTRQQMYRALLLNSEITDDMFRDTQSKNFWERCKSESKADFEKNEQSGEDFAVNFLPASGNYTGYHFLRGVKLIVEYSPIFKTFFADEVNSSVQTGDDFSTYAWKLVSDCIGSDERFQKSFSENSERITEFSKHVERFLDCLKTAFNSLMGHQSCARIHLKPACAKYLFLWSFTFHETPDIQKKFTQLLLMWILFSQKPQRYNLVYPLGEGGKTVVNNISMMCKSRDVDSIFLLTSVNDDGKKVTSSFLDPGVCQTVTRSVINSINNDENVKKYFPVFRKVVYHQFSENYVSDSDTKVTYEIEHIIPQSTTGSNGNVNIDSFGNTMPIRKSLNAGRSNKSISHYHDVADKDGGYLQNLINSGIIPSRETYDSIVNHGELINRPMFVPESGFTEFRRMCERNESVYIKCLVQRLMT